VWKGKTVAPCCYLSAALVNGLLAVLAPCCEQAAIDSMKSIISCVLTVAIVTVIPGPAQQEPGISQSIISGFPDVQLHI
jgi:hypothetical protein